MTEDHTAPSDRQSNAAYLLLHPEDLEGLVGMEEASGARPGRASRDEITLHKNNAGTGAADIAIAMVAYLGAKAQGRGRWLDLAPIEGQ